MAERDSNGKFIKGVSGNPNGRPKKEREDRFYEILLSAVTFDDWKRIVQKAAEQAKRGDAMARKWLADYLVGPAQQKLDVTTNGENINNTIEITGVNYRTAITNLAPGSMGDSDAPGESESAFDGETVG